MQFYSPLRYPGGKSKLSNFLTNICKINDIDGHYVEPYAGGAAVALHLLLNGHVKEITINDYDRSLYAFWYSAINETSKFCKLIDEADLTIKNWQKQREVQRNKNEVDLLTLGFSTFFLNRTNRSGIIDGGAIGGLNQKGPYKIDCRFNKGALIERIKLIATHKKSINICNLDALQLIIEIQKKTKSKNVIFYFDPPYFLKGQSLYLNSYEPNDHKAVSDKIKKIKNARWIVSYDNVPQIRSLYKGGNIKSKTYSLTHSAYKSREGKEILFFDRSLKVPVKISG
jgi:DNA adenine methylase